MVAPDGCLPMPAEADFVICGSIDPARPQARGALWRPPRLLQPPARFSRAAGRTRLPPRRRHLAVHLGRPAAAGRHHVRRLDPRADRPDHPQRAPRRPRGARRRRRRRAPAAPGHRQRAVRARRPSATAAGNPDHRQRHAGPGPAVAGQVPADRRPRRPTRARHPRHSALPRAPARARRLANRPALPDPDDDRHARLLGPRPEPGLEGRDRRRRADAARPGRRAARPACACPRVSAIRGSCCPASWPIQATGLPGGIRRHRLVLPLLRVTTTRSAASR